MDATNTKPATLTAWQGAATFATGSRREEDTVVSVSLSDAFGSVSDSRRIGLAFYAPGWDFLANVNMGAAEARRVAGILLAYAERVESGR